MVNGCSGRSDTVEERIGELVANEKKPFMMKHKHTKQV